MEGQTNRPKQCINVQVLALTSSIYDHFIVWLSSATLTFNLHKQMFKTAILLLEDNILNILKSMHKCTSYGLDKLNLWPFWTLFDPYDLDLQPTWKYVSNGTSPHWGQQLCNFFFPCINVQIMALTSSIYDHFDLNLMPVTLTFNLPDKMFHMVLLLLEDNNCAKLFEIHA